VISGDTNVVKYGAGVDLLIHEVAIVRSELASEPYIQRIMAHHATAREAGTIFGRARPKLAVFTHLVFLASEQILPASLDDLIAETRQTYGGPLEVGEDLMSFEIGDVVNVNEQVTREFKALTSVIGALSSLAALRRSR
jgi:ribonuclease Z